MDAAELSPIPESQRTQPAFDLFLIFAAANVVATTLQTGAVLGSRYGSTDAVVLVVSGLLYLTNFAWIAVNNTIAASVCAQLFGGESTARVWAAVLGLLATAIVARGPRGR